MNSSTAPGKTRFFQLQLVLAVARHGTLHKAAEELSRTQPAVTRSLKELESQLGVPLFERSAHGMKLSLYGRHFARHAQIIVNQFQSAVQILDEIKSGNHQHVNIAMLPATAPELMPRVVKRLDNVGAKISINLRSGISELILPHLVEGKLDMIVGRMLNENKENLSQIPLMHDPFSIVCGPQHRLAKKFAAPERKSAPRRHRPRLKLSALLNESWIFPTAPSSLLMRDVNEAFISQGCEPPKSSLEVFSTQAFRKILRTTDRIGLMSHQVARDEEQFGLLTVLPVDFKSNFTRIGIITRPFGEVSAAVRIIADLIVEVSHDLNGEQPPPAEK